jgi:hypothetical protein
LPFSSAFHRVGPAGAVGGNEGFVDLRGIDIYPALIIGPFFWGDQVFLHIQSLTILMENDDTAWVVPGFPSKHTLLNMKEN